MTLTAAADTWDLIGREIAEWIDPHRNPDTGTVWYSCPQCDRLWEKGQPQQHEDDCVVGRCRHLAAESEVTADAK